jgi:hypothetical protein
MWDLSVEWVSVDENQFDGVIAPIIHFWSCLHSGNATNSPGHSGNATNSSGHWGVANNG